MFFIFFACVLFFFLNNFKKNFSLFYQNNRYHYLNQDNSGLIWLVSGLQHMAKMIEWSPHSLGLQNIHMVINWMTKHSSSTIPKLLPAEFVESLRARVQNESTQLRKSEMSDIQNRLSSAGITLSEYDYELLR